MLLAPFCRFFVNLIKKSLTICLWEKDKKYSDSNFQIMGHYHFKVYRSECSTQEDTTEKQKAGRHYPGGTG